MKKRRYTVGISSDNKPIIKIKGQWLKEQGFASNTRYEVIEGKNMLIFAKLPEFQVKEETLKNKISKFKNN